MSQLTVRARITKFHKFGGGYSEGLALLVMAAENRNICFGPCSAQFFTDRLHYVVIEIGDPHAVAWATVT
jgi:hypothetical protein